MRVLIGLLALCLVMAGHAQQRLVVAGGELTEIVYALDAGDRLGRGLCGGRSPQHGHLVQI